MHIGAIVLLAMPGVRATVPSLIASSGPFGKTVLLVLLVMSIYCWAVIWSRWRLFSRVERADRRFLASFRKLTPSADFRLVCEQHPASLLARVALTGQRSLDQLGASPEVTTSMRYEMAQRAMDRSAHEESAWLERHVGFLGTTGSVAPFIGLMGTVWGVMSAFLNIGAQGSASLVVVAPGIAEALITTIAGLAAAIPAVVAYNHFIGRLRDFMNQTAQFASEFLDRRAEARRA